MTLRARLKRLTYDSSRISSRLAGVAWFSLRCEGRRNWPSTGGALVCSNHQSYLDPILVGLSCERHLNYLARRSLFRIPFFRALIDWYDAIPIEREGMGLGGIKETLRRVRRGEMVVIFPEGTRTTDGRVGPFKPGFCALARRGRVPLVPMAIAGADRVWPRTRSWPWPSGISIQVGPPVTPEEIATLTDDQLVSRIRDAVVCCHNQASAKLPNI